MNIIENTNLFVDFAIKHIFIEGSAAFGKDLKTE